MLNINYIINYLFLNTINVKFYCKIRNLFKFFTSHQVCNHKYKIIIEQIDLILILQELFFFLVIKIIIFKVIIVIIKTIIIKFLQIIIGIIIIITVKTLVIIIKFVDKLMAAFKSFINCIIIVIVIKAMPSIGVIFIISKLNLMKLINLPKQKCFTKKDLVMNRNLTINCKLNWDKYSFK